MKFWQDMGRSVRGAFLFAFFETRSLDFYRTDWIWVGVSYLATTMAIAVLWLASGTWEWADVSASWRPALFIILISDVIACLVGIALRFPPRWRLFFVNYCWVSVPVYGIGLIVSIAGANAPSALTAITDLLFTLFIVYNLILTWPLVRRPLSFTIRQTLLPFIAFSIVLLMNWHVISIDWDM
jgi:hypothetical protein